MNLPINPSAWRNSHRWSPSRLLRWTVPRRYHEILSRLKHRSLLPQFQAANAVIEPERGPRLEETAVTTGQLRLLLAAVHASEHLSLPIVEIGSFRGVTTSALAKETQRQIIAVDPYVGDGGHSKDRKIFESRTALLKNVTLIPKSSGDAFEAFPFPQISLVFIDAIHEYVHAWFDFRAWSSLIVEGGLVAFHDSDDFSGVNGVCHQILKSDPGFQPWGHAPNLAIFQKKTLPE